jgi:hypothetical protein
MAKNLNPVGLDFLANAPYRVVAELRVGHSIAAVFEAIAERPEDWGRWYPGFGDGGRYSTPQPPGVGTIREMRVGGLPVTETLIAWDEPTRWAFFINRATMPGIRALAEDYQLAPDGDATVLTWTLALDLAPAAKPLGLILGPATKALGRRAFGNLDRRLGSVTSN